MKVITILEQMDLAYILKLQQQQYKTVYFMTIYVVQPALMVMYMLMMEPPQ